MARSDGYKGFKILPFQFLCLIYGFALAADFALSSTSRLGKGQDVKVFLPGDPSDCLGRPVIPNTKEIEIVLLQIVSFVKESVVWNKMFAFFPSI